MANELRNMKLDWYTMKNVADEEDATAEIYVYDEIGGSFGVGAMDFIDELNAMTAPEIVVRINSPGGLLIDAIAISNALAQHPSKITTRVDGIAASAASIIAVSGDVCEMMNGSQLMIHDVLCGVQGNAKDMREAAAWLEEQSQNVATIYAKKAGGDPEEWRQRMLAETWMFADEAVGLGLADNLYERNKDFATKQAAEEAPPDEEKEEPEVDPEEEETEESSDEEEAKALEALMFRKHRLTNRGFKYLGRNKAPAPQIAEMDDLLDTYFSRS